MEFLFVFQLRKKEREKKEVLTEKDALNERLDEIKHAKAKSDSLFKSEQSTNVGLRKQLQFYESQQKSLELERKEFQRVKRKLVDLQSVETLLNGMVENGYSKNCKTWDT